LVSHRALVARTFLKMARLHPPHHSTSSDHEPLLHDFQGQGSDHERPDEETGRAKNDEHPEDGGKREGIGISIYPRWFAGASGRNSEAYLKDIKSEAHLEAHPEADPEHRDLHHHTAVATIRDANKVSLYHSAPLLHIITEVRYCFVDIT
jgi:hypothetical protein